MPFPSPHHRRALLQVLVLFPSSRRLQLLRRPRFELVLGTRRVPPPPHLLPLSSRRVWLGSFSAGGTPWQPLVLPPPWLPPLLPPPWQPPLPTSPWLPLLLPPPWQPLLLPPPWQPPLPTSPWLPLLLPPPWLPPLLPPLGMPRVNMIYLAW